MATSDKNKILLRESQKKRSHKTKNRLVNAVIDIITEGGFSSLTTTKVAQTAGVSRGAMQHHFRTKNELLIGIVEGIRGRIVNLHAPLVLEVIDKSDIENYVTAILDRYCREFSDPIFPTLIEIWMGSRSEPQLFMQINSLLQEILSESADHWVDFFKDFKIPKKQLMIAHELLRSTIRGLALRKMFGGRKTLNISQNEKRAMIKFIITILEDDI